MRDSTRRPASKYEDLPDLHILVRALECYDAIREGARNVAEAAKQLGINKDVLYRSIKSFEDQVGLGREIFVMKGGRHAATGWGEAAHETFRDIREILDLYRRILPGPPRIRLGASLTLCTHLVPAVLRSFRESPQGRKVEVDVTHAMPQVLRERGKQGDLDLVLTSCPENFQEDVATSIRLQMYLICPNRHKLAGGKFHWDELKGQTVVLLAEERSPMPSYPLDKIPPEARITRVRSYLQAHYMVLGGGDVVCFSFPQLFDEEQKRLLEAIRVEGLEKVRVCLIRPSAARARRTAEENKVIDALEGKLSNRMTDIERLYSVSTGSEPPGPGTTFHATKVQGKEDYVWLRGKLDWRLTEDRYVKGKHSVHGPRGKGTQTYAVFGRSVVNGRNKCHVMWRGMRQDLQSQEEDYAASFICEKNDLVTGPLVGVWVGRQTWSERAFELPPSTGYMVIVNDAKNITPSTLKQYIDQYEKNGRHMGLPKPRQICS